MRDTDNIAATSDRDRVRRLGGTAVVVGVVPWALAALLHAGRLALSDGGLGLRIALREMVAAPMLWLPAVAVLLFAAAARRSAPSVSSDPVARAFIVASVVWVGILGVLLLAGNTTFGADGLWFYVRLTAYLPLVAAAAAVRTLYPPMAHPAHRILRVNLALHRKPPERQDWGREYFNALAGF